MKKTPIKIINPRIMKIQILKENSDFFPYNKLFSSPTTSTGNLAVTAPVTLNMPSPSFGISLKEIAIL